jgi:hypothetical protein
MESKIEIKTERDNLVTKIFFDGQQIKGVRSFTLRQDAETRIPILNLDIRAVDISVDCPLLKVNQDGIGEIKYMEFQNGMHIGDKG